MYKQLSLEIVGTAPLVMHNGQTADPLNNYAKMLKEISAKRKKLMRTMRRLLALSLSPPSTWTKADL